ncbi:MAG: glycosyltransferase [Acidimicrobiales bacterium]
MSASPIAPTPPTPREGAVPRELRSFLGRFALVAVGITAIDVALLVVAYHAFGWSLAAADLAAITVAASTSYLAHRNLTFRSDPFVRWVYQPGAVAVVVTLAGLADLSVLTLLVDPEPGRRASWQVLVAAKLTAVLVAAILRGVCYRWVLFQRVRRTQQLQTARERAPGDLRLSVVVPAYCEQERIGQTVARLHHELAAVAADGGLEVIVVDDGSADATAQAARDAGAEVVVDGRANTGKGGAVRDGVLVARGRTVAFTDADLAYSPDQLMGLLVEVERGWDMVVGSRRHTGTTTLVKARRIREIGGRLINLLTTTLLLGQYRDTQCGLKAFRSDAARLLFAQTRINGFAFDIELFHLAERYELSVLEVPVRVENSERSTVKVARDAMRLAWDLVRVRRWAKQGLYAEHRQEVLEPVEPGGR